MEIGRPPKNPTKIGENRFPKNCSGSFWECSRAWKTLKNARKTRFRSEKKLKSSEKHRKQSEKKSEKKMSRNEPGSRISSNLRTPDHLGRIPSPELFRFFRSEITFFERFSRFFKPGNTPRMILNDFGENDFRRFSSIFVGFFGGSPDFRRKSW